MDTRWSGEAKYQTLLAVSQAANARRELSRVLEALMAALDGSSRRSHRRGHPRRRRDRVHGLRFRGDPRLPGESQAAYVRRFTEATGAKAERLRAHAHGAGRPGAGAADAGGQRRPEQPAARRGRDQASRWRVPGGAAADHGRRVRRRPAGRAHAASPFRTDEVTILEDVARPVTTAVANALAFEEIQALRGLLEDENLALREEITAAAAAGGIIGASAGLRDVLERVARVAATDSTVLITGETGTGKELVARAIHTGSPRARRALVKVAAHPPEDWPWPWPGGGHGVVYCFCLLLR